MRILHTASAEYDVRLFFMFHGSTQSFQITTNLHRCKAVKVTRYCLYLLSIIMVGEYYCGVRKTRGNRLLRLLRLILSTLQVYWSRGKWGNAGLESRLNRSDDIALPTSFSCTSVILHSELESILQLEKNKVSPKSQF